MYIIYFNAYVKLLLGIEYHYTLQHGLEKETAPTPMFLPGKIPWTAEPGRLYSKALQSWTGLRD